jgi:type I restriction enzyme M protein
MSTDTTNIGQQIWSYCTVLRDDGFSYSDYLQELTYLLFLKMDDESFARMGRTSSVP